MKHRDKFYKICLLIQLRPGQQILEANIGKFNLIRQHNQNRFLDIVFYSMLHDIAKLAKCSESMFSLRSYHHIVLQVFARRMRNYLNLDKQTALFFLWAMQTKNDNGFAIYIRSILKTELQYKNQEPRSESARCIALPLTNVCSVDSNRWAHG